MQVEGLSANVENPVTTGSGASLTANADGSVSYCPGGGIHRHRFGSHQRRDPGPRFPDPGFDRQQHRHQAGRGQQRVKCGQWGRDSPPASPVPPPAVDPRQRPSARALDANLGDTAEDQRQRSGRSYHRDRTEQQRRICTISRGSDVSSCNGPGIVADNGDAVTYRRHRRMDHHLERRAGSRPHLHHRTADFNGSDSFAFTVDNGIIDCAATGRWYRPRQHRRRYRDRRSARSPAAIGAELRHRWWLDVIVTCGGDVTNTTQSIGRTGDQLHWCCRDPLGRHHRAPESASTLPPTASAP